ncbi:MAG: serine hydrolase domain-containing protein [Bacteroidota bacterium]
MRIKKEIAILLLLSILNCQSPKPLTKSSLRSPENVDLSSDSLAKMTTYFHQLVDEKKLAGVQIGILQKEKLVYFDTYGFADIENNKALEENSIFRIFSMTKPIVSVALMQLYEQEKFQLNDPLHQYIPAFKDAKILQDSAVIPSPTPVRIIDLLRHTSGYSYGRINNPKLSEYYVQANLNSSTNNKDFVNKLAKIPLQFEPGTNWQYGLSTNIVGRLVEVLSGNTLDQYLQDHILTPLQMNDTHFQLPKDKVSRFTVGYRWSEENGLYVSETADDNRYVREVTLFNGGGGLVSTTVDYLNFCQMLLNKGKWNGERILQAETIDLMLSDHLETVQPHQAGPLRLPPNEASFGLGFAIKGDSPDKLQEVFGWGGAVGTYFKIDTKNDLAYVMMIQISPYRHLGLRSKLQDFVNAAIVKS